VCDRKALLPTIGVDDHPLPRITVDEPAIAMTIGTNPSPMAGRDPKPGSKLTARLVKLEIGASDSASGALCGFAAVGLPAIAPV